MFRFIRNIYNSKTFTRGVFVLGFAVAVAYFFKTPEKAIKGSLTFGAVVLSIFALLIIAVIVLIFLGFLIRIYVKYKLRKNPFKYILVYPDKESWRTIVDVEIRPIFDDSLLIIKFDKDSDRKTFSFNNMVVFAYSVNIPGIYIVSSNKRFDLWKAVRKAAYGYPTKLNNLKVKIQKDIKTSESNQ